MSLTVYGAALSPFVRKLRVALREKNLPYEHVHIDPAKKPDYFLELNPLGRIPVLKDGDLVLADSSIICTYLDNKYPAISLHPQDPIALAQVQWFEKFADYELAPLLTFTVFRQRVLAGLRGGQPDEAAVQAALNNKIPALFDYLEKAVKEKEFIVGDTFSIADVAIAVQIANMSYGGETVDETRWPALAHYAKGIQARPSLQPLIDEESQVVAKIRSR